MLVKDWMNLLQDEYFLLLSFTTILVALKDCKLGSILSPIKKHITYNHIIIYEAEITLTGSRYCGLLYNTLWIAETKWKKVFRQQKLPTRKQGIPKQSDKIWEFISKIQWRCGVSVNNTLRTWNVSSNDSDTDHFRRTLVHWPIKS